ncbi:2-amino-4-hydroxy-6-hydroxymethyldihydropteridine diphosphokinase [Nesterenkonia aerolata]|uniref:Bifunctional folate synthesis protein n=1 Tax=Nesterenkonia aerolata TaxID=3074079 RepID=A0ABU2DUL5_9MICC|nr:2-amino-4-hydroxy-6-hydroxymethyldihydropteridine diphosphokinase [Nesterenkonia sp. LY-0111]MDR8020066.1 2-amino-4-hydroxy-6-hydroxymethyldihydropteridine diphosphokinase [Nesterenkonia sp. LY-0111]
MDRIRLTGVTAVGRHGVFDHERREGQQFRVDVELSVDLRRAGASDELRETVNYAEIADVVESAITGAPYDLIEALAERIAVDVLRGDARIEAAQVTVHKPEAPLSQRVDDVAVTITRNRDDVGAQQRPAPGEIAAPGGRTLRDPDLAADFPVRSVLALGSNLGDSATTLQQAVAALAEAEGVRLLRRSPLAVTAPVGGPEGQPEFLNQVLEVETTLSPHALLDVAQRIEAAHQRTREVRWGPRTLDVDVITYAGAQIDSDRLRIPHPRAAERAFVLAPWSWMDPIALLEGAPVRELAARAADAAGVRRFDDASEGGL